jgi:hypothetical protein
MLMTNSNVKRHCLDNQGKSMLSDETTMGRAAVFSGIHLHSNLAKFRAFSLLETTGHSDSQMILITFSSLFNKHSNPAPGSIHHSSNFTAFTPPSAPSTFPQTNKMPKHSTISPAVRSLSSSALAPSSKIIFVSFNFGHFLIIFRSYFRFLRFVRHTSHWISLIMKTKSSE